MSLADEFKTLASDMVSEFSSEATLRRVTDIEGTFDPVTGTYTGDSVTQDYSIEVTPPKAYREALIDGSLVQRNDFSVFVADIPVVPDVADSNTTDTLLLNGSTYNIVSVQPKSLPDNMVAGYTLQLRG